MWVRHISQLTVLVKKGMAEYVPEWKADALRYLGDWPCLQTCCLYALPCIALQRALLPTAQTAQLYIHSVNC